MRGRAQTEWFVWMSLAKISGSEIDAIPSFSAAGGHNRRAYRCIPETFIFHLRSVVAQHHWIGNRAEHHEDACSFKFRCERLRNGSPRLLVAVRLCRWKNKPVPNAATRLSRTAKRARPATRSWLAAIKQSGTTFRENPR